MASGLPPPPQVSAEKPVEIQLLMVILVLFLTRLQRKRLLSVSWQRFPSRWWATSTHTSSFLPRSKLQHKRSCAYLNRILALCGARASLTQHRNLLCCMHITCYALSICSSLYRVCYINFVLSGGTVRNPPLL